MNMDKANYTKVRFNCREVIFLAPLLTKMHTDPQFSFWFQAMLYKQMPENASQQNLEKGKFEE